MTTICHRCKKRTAQDGFVICQICREKNRMYIQRCRQRAKGLIFWEPQRPPESVESIIMKAKAHGLSYGKYLEARARGEYQEEEDT